MAIYSSFFFALTTDETDFRLACILFLPIPEVFLFIIMYFGLVLVLVFPPRIATFSCKPPVVILVNPFASASASLKIHAGSSKRMVNKRHVGTILKDTLRTDLTRLKVL